MTIPDGPYAYYATETQTRPTIVEAMANYISECGEEGWVPLSMYPGRFVRLQEVTLAEPDATQVVDNKPAKL